METNKEKFLKLVSSDVSGVHKIMQWRKDNNAWLEKSFTIATRVLVELSKQNKSKQDLAVASGLSEEFINRIVKGAENLTLETISKLEMGLGIKLIEIA